MLQRLALLVAQIKAVEAERGSGCGRYKRRPDMS